MIIRPHFLEIGRGADNPAGVELRLGARSWRTGLSASSIWSVTKLTEDCPARSATVTPSRPNSGWVGPQNRPKYSRNSRRYSSDGLRSITRQMASEARRAATAVRAPRLAITSIDSVARG